VVRPAGVASVTTGSPLHIPADGWRYNLSRPSVVTGISAWPIDSNGPAPDDVKHRRRVSLPSPYRTKTVRPAGSVESPRTVRAPVARTGRTSPEPAGRTTYQTLYLLPEPPREFLPDGRGTTHLLARATACTWDWDDRFVRFLPGPGFNVTDRWVATWTPAVPPDSSMATAPVDWIAPAYRVLEVAGVDAEGNLYWSEFDGRNPEVRQSRTATRTHPDGFRAVCLVAPGAVMAATGRNEVSRFRVTGMELQRTSGPVTVSMPSRVVFLASRLRANGVVAITEDGSAVTIPGL